LEKREDMGMEWVRNEPSGGQKEEEPRDGARRERVMESY